VDEKTRKIEHDPDDLRLVATVYHAAARQLAGSTGDRWVRIPVATTLEGYSLLAHKWLLQEQAENLPADLLESWKQLRAGVKALPLNHFLDLTFLPLPALSREFAPDHHD
jgi:hypothetical protein